MRIEDILPLFPDFVEIDAFKDAICRWACCIARNKQCNVHARACISPPGVAAALSNPHRRPATVPHHHNRITSCLMCSSLEAYNREIEELKGEMQNATTTVQAIRCTHVPGLGMCCTPGRAGGGAETLVLYPACMPACLRLRLRNLPGSTCLSRALPKAPLTAPSPCQPSSGREDLARLEHRSAALDSAEPCARCGRPLHAPPPGSAGPSGGSLPKLFLFPTGDGALAPPCQQAPCQ